MRKNTYDVPVHARLETIRAVLRRRAEHPEEEIPGAGDVRISERSDDGFLRETEARGMKIRERVLFRDDGEGWHVIYRLEDHPLMAGKVEYRAVPTSRDSPVAPVTLNLVIDWVPKGGNPEAEAEVIRDMDEAMQRSLETVRQEAEAADREG